MKYKKWIFVGIAVAISISLLVWYTLSLQPQTSTVDNPRFSTVIPAGYSIDELGGWRTSTTPNGTQVYAFSDTLSGVSITVTQQQKPDSLSDDVETRLEKLANGFNATVKLSVDDAVAYLGTSAKGPQSVLIAKNDLLILIQSEKAIPNEDWVTYINQLKQS